MVETDKKKQERDKDRKRKKKIKSRRNEGEKDRQAQEVRTKKEERRLLHTLLLLLAGFLFFWKVSDVPQEKRVKRILERNGKRTKERRKPRFYCEMLSGRKGKAAWRREAHERREMRPRLGDNLKKTKEEMQGKRRKRKETEDQRQEDTRPGRKEDARSLRFLLCLLGPQFFFFHAEPAEERKKEEKSSLLVVVPFFFFFFFFFFLHLSGSMPHTVSMISFSCSP